MSGKKKCFACRGMNLCEVEKKSMNKIARRAACSKANTIKEEKESVLINYEQFENALQTVHIKGNESRKNGISAQSYFAAKVIMHPHKMEWEIIYFTCSFLSSGPSLSLDLYIEYHAFHSRPKILKINTAFSCHRIIYPFFTLFHCLWFAFLSLTLISFFFAQRTHLEWMTIAVIIIIFGIQFLQSPQSVP